MRTRILLLYTLTITLHSNGFSAMLSFWVSPFIYSLMRTNIYIGYMSHFRGQVGKVLDAIQLWIPLNPSGKCVLKSRGPLDPSMKSIGVFVYMVLVLVTYSMVRTHICIGFYVTSHPISYKYGASYSPPSTCVLKP